MRYDQCIVHHETQAILLLGFFNNYDSSVLQ